MHIRPPDRLIRVTPLETRRTLGRRTLRWMIAGSVLLHLLIFLAIVFVHPMASPEQQETSANNEVAMVFQSTGQTSPSTKTPNPAQNASTALGHPNGATETPQPAPTPQPPPAPTPQPQPQPQAQTQPQPTPTPAPPQPEPPQPQVEASNETPPQPTPPQPTPPQPTPPQPPQPQPTPQPPPPQLEAQPPQPQPAPPAPTPPKVPPTVSLQSSDQGELPLPPPFVMPQPPTPLPPLPPRPPPPPPRPRITQQSVPRSSSGFPMPQNWSLSTGPGSLLSQKGTDVASTTRGSHSDSEYRHVAGADPGEDWAAELHRWASEHAYYPPQAAENGEEGMATVQVTINRYGKVLSTDLVSRSGSSFLDMAWVGEWRNATVPRFPPGTPDDTTTIMYTIHYILIHGR